MHLTCTNMPVEKLKEALDKVGLGNHQMIGTLSRGAILGGVNGVLLVGAGGGCWEIGIRWVKVLAGGVAGAGGGAGSGRWRALMDAGKSTCEGWGCWRGWDNDMRGVCEWGAVCLQLFAPATPAVPRHLCCCSCLLLVQAKEFGIHNILGLRSCCSPDTPSATPAAAAPACCCCCCCGGAAGEGVWDPQHSGAAFLLSP